MKYSAALFIIQTVFNIANASEPLEFSSPPASIPPPAIQEVSATSLNEIIKKAFESVQKFSQHMLDTTEVAADYQMIGPHYRVFELMIRAKPLLLPETELHRGNGDKSESLVYFLPITVVMRMNGTQMEAPELSQLSIALMGAHQPMFFPERKLVHVPFEEFEWSALDVGYQKNPLDLGAYKRLRTGQIKITRVFDVAEDFKKMRVLVGIQAEHEVSWIWKHTTQSELRQRLHPDVKPDHQSSGSTGHVEAQLGLVIGVWHSIRGIVGISQIGDTISVKDSQQELSDFQRSYYGASYDYQLNPNWRFTLNWKREKWDIKTAREGATDIEHTENAINTYFIGIKYGK